MINFKGGLPRCDIHTTVRDLCDLGLLRKINKLKFEAVKTKFVNNPEIFICPKCNAILKNKAKYQLLKNKDNRLKPQVI